MLFLKFLTALHIVVAFAQEEEPITDNPMENTDSTPLDVNSTTIVDSLPTETDTDINNENETTTIFATTNDGDIIITSSPTNDSISNETSTGNEDVTTSELTTETDYSSFCPINVCSNGATCILSSNGTSHNCVCASGFVGDRCQTYDRCEKNANDVICGDGACVSSEDLSSRQCQCFLNKYWDSEIKDCRESENPCFPNPCRNNGTCVSNTTDDYSCKCPKEFIGDNCALLDLCDSGCKNGECILDAQKSIQYCQCDNGYYYDSETRSCQEITPPCKPDPCNGHGKCNIVGDKEYNCTCEQFYFGRNCEYLNLCFEDENGQICVNGFCELDESTFAKKCKCNTGFYFEEHSGTCRESKKPCYPNPCQNGGTCIPNGETHTCSCIEGYTDVDCSLRDRCDTDGGVQFCNGSYCFLGKDYITFFCQCEDYEYFDYNQRTCLTLNVCPIMKCGKNQVCINSTCQCEIGFKPINGSDDCEPNFCEFYGCPGENMKCKENYNSPKDFNCFCDKGQTFDGSRCSIAFCTFPSLNGCQQECDYDKENYKCGCKSPLILNEDNKTCSIPQNNTCDNTTCAIGICFKEGGTEMCSCPPGYTEKDGKCVDLCTANQLSPNTCPNDDCAPDAKLGFKCVCSGKYEQSNDGVTCKIKDVCFENGEGTLACSKLNGICIKALSTDQGYYCQCQQGYVKTEGGVCKKICDIEENQKKCSHIGATCIPFGNYNFTCRCSPTFTFGKNGMCNKLAEFSFTVSLPLITSKYKLIDARSSESAASYNSNLVVKDISDALMRYFGGFQYINLLNCKNMMDFILCKVEVQLTYLGVGENFSRLLMPSSYFRNISDVKGKSLSPPSLLLKTDKIKSYVSFQKTDPCQEDIKEELCDPNTVCKSSKDDFTCVCKPGYRARKRTYPIGSTDTFIESCTDIDECVEENSCPSSTKCVNTIGGYQCECLPGFRESNATSGSGCVEICNPNPCVHGTCDQSGDHTFECLCDAGYSGAICNFEDKNYKGAKINTVIVGVVLGGILLITIILFVSSVTRLRRKKYSEEPSQILYSTEMTEQRSVTLSAANPSFEKDL